MFDSEFDVAVVGGGPGGSATAKRCAEHGLKTLLLEKRKLPRDKVCTGMIMSDMAQTLIKEEFGEFPREVLTTPPYVNGIVFHMPGVKSRIMEHRMPFAWRRDLDYWMNQKVREVGGKIWDGVHITGFIKSDKYIVSLQREGRIEEIEVRFVVGADGTTSMVRKSFFPNLKLRYVLIVRECYQSKLDLYIPAASNSLRSCSLNLIDNLL